ncbi:MAG: hypothetical protein KJ798_11420 [Gammaproteobacteria bacterium]|nr:hypothetical protein [Gammaproteobacteria bacterium]MBU0850050.1 hypothetical protein [Gammaproteobacteria bacterium]MBU1268538.1 hypothetical protein [Gammaproteobacteria bacterium]MBU1528086.1 hypothetical protein [Gammaproteobacteria bacterium]MBU1780979.1 hypothetical protein [Gammaproteobacteria bacterium]
MANYVHTCPPSAGWDWLMQGVQLFRKKPGEMFLFGNTYLFIILFVGLLIPFLGAAVVAIASPAMGFGIMLAGRMGQKGLRVSPIVLFSGFTPEHRKHLQSLIVLGAIYTACFAVIKLLAHLLLGAQPNVSIEDLQKADPAASAAFMEYMVLYMVFVGITSIPVLLAFWFAPVLVVWHNMKPVQALFSSWVAVWRNKASFFIYGMGWLVLGLGFSSVFVVIFTMLGLPTVFVSALNMMCVALVMAVSLCTFYPTYKAVFEHDPTV